MGGSDRRSALFQRSDKILQSHRVGHSEAVVVDRAAKKIYSSPRSGIFSCLKNSFLFQNSNTGCLAVLWFCSECTIAIPPGVDIFQIGPFFSPTSNWGVHFLPGTFPEILTHTPLLNVKLLRFGPLWNEIPVFSLIFYFFFSKKVKKMVHEVHFRPKNEKRYIFRPDLRSASSWSLSS